MDSTITYLDILNMTKGQLVDEMERLRNDWDQRIIEARRERDEALDKVRELIIQIEELKEGSKGNAQDN